MRRRRVLILILLVAVGRHRLLRPVPRWRCCRSTAIASAIAPASANSGHVLLERLLAEPDRWLGANLVILALASVAATTAATLLALRTGVHWALPLMMVALTIVMIVFCELAPKIFAAVHAESVALGSAYIYRVLLWICTAAGVAQQPASRRASCACSASRAPRPADAGAVDRRAADRGRGSKSRWCRSAIGRCCCRSSISST